MKLSKAGVDIAKSVFHVNAINHHERTWWQIKLKHSGWQDALFQRLALAVQVGMEACASAHHWARKL